MELAILSKYKDFKFFYFNFLDRQQNTNTDDAQPDNSTDRV